MMTAIHQSFRKSTCWILIVTLVLVNNIHLKDADTSFNQSNMKNKTSNQQAQLASRRPRRLQQQLYFSQKQQNPYQTSTHFGLAPRWFSPTVSSDLREPANIPTVISQEDAKYLERYMKNFAPVSDDGTNQTPLNLASINNRAGRFEAAEQQQQGLSSTTSAVNHYNQQKPKSLFYASNEVSLPSMPLWLSQAQDTLKQRSDIATSADGPMLRREFKKGKVDNVLLFGSNPPPPQHLNAVNNKQQYPISPAKQLVNQFSQKAQHSLDKWSQNCIKRAESFTSQCEDHLIKRLSQDATEGRTAMDVERRVCCALFWHKDCVYRIVVETCPDSSPAAADLLMGSRKLDISLSCQRFNREGCNGSLSSLEISRLALLSLFVYLSIALLISINLN